jgi:zinc protease
MASTAESEVIEFKLKVEKFTLPNGLTVLLHEDHTVPMVSYHTWYRVGSRDESPGVTGAAHMLEHMMFQGAAQYSGEQLHAILDQNGIEWNAFTSNDYTGFYMNLPAQHLDTVMQLEVDRMSSLLIAEKNLTSEREVVKEERRMRVDNSPFGQMHEAVMGMIFQGTRYEWPVIGHMRDIEKYSSSTLRKFYETYYVPSNAVLVLAGHFEPEAVKKLIEKYYGKLAKKDKPTRPVSETKWPPAQSLKLAKDIQNTIVSVSYPSVSALSQQMYALDLLSAILGMGSSSRLYSKLVTEKQTASSVSASNQSFLDLGTFSISVQLKKNQNPDQILAELEKQILTLRRQKISEGELRKAKTLVMKSYVDSLLTLDSKARSLATAEIINGSYESLFKDLTQYEQVTIDDVFKVAREYLKENQKQVVIFEARGAK